MKSNIVKAKRAVYELFQLMHSTEWRISKREKDEITVEERETENVGKIYRLTVLLDCSPSSLFNILWTNVENQPKWNPTLSETKVIKKISKDTDLIYFGLTPAAGGLVASRDFVSLRRYEKKAGLVFLAGIDPDEHDFPEKRGRVRAENGLGGYVIKAVPGNAEKCELVWFLSANLKGWLPQRLVDYAMKDVMVETVRGLRRYIATLS